MTLKPTLLFVSLGALCFGMARAHAESPKAPKKAMLSISCSCDDEVGKAYGKALSAAVAGSPVYKEVSEDESVNNGAITIHIVSMPLPDDGTGKPKSALSIVALHDGSLLHQFIETCNRIPIEDCAASLVADIKHWDRQE